MWIEFELQFHLNCSIKKFRTIQIIKRLLSNGKASLLINLVLSISCKEFKIKIPDFIYFY